MADSAVLGAAVGAAVGTTPVWIASLTVLPLANVIAAPAIARPESVEYELNVMEA